MDIELIKNNLRTIPDFPQKGILFRDITTVLKNPLCIEEIVRDFSEHYQGLGITKVLGIESRGFIFGALLAYTLHAGFVPIRKLGKLPANTISQEYSLEYGVNEVEMHVDALTSEDIVLIHDDLIATGGTMKAAYNLCRKMGVKKIYINSLVELSDLKGRENFPKEVDIYCPISYEGE